MEKRVRRAAASEIQTLCGRVPSRPPQRQGLEGRGLTGQHGWNTAGGTQPGLRIGSKLAEASKTVHLSPGQCVLVGGSV